MKWIIGVDEVGRGPLAGPVSVGIFAAELRTNKWLLKNLFQNRLRDSKKLSREERGAISKKIQKLKKEGKVFFAVCHVSNKIIDEKGISFAINYAIKKNLINIKHRVSGIGEVRLDELLHAPIEFKKQRTIIKGDEKDIFIACASIMAKVSRDALMCRLAKKYPWYKFELHKGYGTRLHRLAIKKHGLSALHRASFCASMAVW